MSFFHTTPLGRIVNRFTKDVGDIDRYLITLISLMLTGVFGTLSTFAGIGIATPYSLLIAVPLCWLFYLLQRYYQCTAREIKRLDATSRSPVFSLFDQTSTGYSSIRAFRYTLHMHAAPSH